MRYYRREPNYERDLAMFFFGAWSILVLQRFL